MDGTTVQKTATSSNKRQRGSARWSVGATSATNRHGGASFYGPQVKAPSSCCGGDGEAYDSAPFWSLLFSVPNFALPIISPSVTSLRKIKAGRPLLTA